MKFADKKILFWILFTLFNALPLLQVKQAQGAACCGKSAAAPFLMVGDDQSQMSLGIALGNSVAHIGGDGVPNFGSSKNSDISQSYKLDLATLLSDRIQGGVSLPVTTFKVSRGELEESSTGIGDVRLNLGYEVLPSWSYSSWKPQGFLFTTLTLPTGRPYERSQRRMATDVTGAGHYSWSMGALLLKKWTLWDVFLVPEVHASFARTFTDQGGDYRLSPGFGGSVGLGVGMSPGSDRLRLGFRIQPRLEQANQLSLILPRGDILISAGAVLAACDTGLDLSYMMSSVDSVAVSYTDQTLLGPAMNSNLSRFLGINYQHRWER